MLHTIESDGNVMISTIHKSKSNEFQVVYHVKEIATVHGSPLAEVAANVDAVRKAIDKGVKG